MKGKLAPSKKYLKFKNSLIGISWKKGTWNNLCLRKCLSSQLTKGNLDLNNVFGYQICKIFPDSILWCRGTKKMALSCIGGRIRSHPLACSQVPLSIQCLLTAVNHVRSQLLRRIEKPGNPVRWQDGIKCLLFSGRLHDAPRSCPNSHLEAISFGIPGDILGAKK